MFFSADCCVLPHAFHQWQMLSIQQKSMELNFLLVDMRRKKRQRFDEMDFNRFFFGRVWFVPKRSGHRINRAIMHYNELCAIKAWTSMTPSH